MQRMSMWQIALRRLEMPILRFLALFVGGAAFAGFFMSIVIILLTGGLAEGALFSGLSGVLLLILLPILSGGAAIVFPILDVQRSATLIEKEMHMFITRMGILSLGEVGAQSIFDILKQMRDYGELATEVQRIETLVDKWHTSLPEASRIVAQQNASGKLSIKFLLTSLIAWRSPSKRANQSMSSCAQSKRRLQNSIQPCMTLVWNPLTQ